MTLFIIQGFQSLTKSHFPLSSSSQTEFARLVYLSPLVGQDAHPCLGASGAGAGTFSLGYFSPWSLSFCIHKSQVVNYTQLNKDNNCFLEHCVTPRTHCPQLLNIGPNSVQSNFSGILTQPVFKLNVYHFSFLLFLAPPLPLKSLKSFSIWLVSIYCRSSPFKRAPGQEKGIGVPLLSGPIKQSDCFTACHLKHEAMLKVQIMQWFQGDQTTPVGFPVNREGE